MPRLVPLAVMFLYASALTISVIGGPWYGYIAAPLLGVIAAGFAFWIASEGVPRLVFGAFTAFFLLSAGFQLVIEELTWAAAREISFPLLIGLANSLCVLCPVNDGGCESESR